MSEKLIPVDLHVMKQSEAILNLIKAAEEMRLLKFSVLTSLTIVVEAYKNVE